MTSLTDIPNSTAVFETSSFDLHVRGEIPALLSGSLLIATNRRNKNRSIFSRWHDSQADLLRLDLYPGRPGRIRAHFLSVDPRGDGLVEGFQDSAFYATQPNHAVNIENNT